MLSKQFWVDALERAIRTFAQAILAVVSVDNASDQLQATWEATLYSALFATGVSVLMSIVASGTGNHNTAAIVTPEKEVK